MERIILEVEPQVATAWKRLSPSRRKEIADKVSVRIGKEAMAHNKDEYVKFLQDLRSKMSQRGLTPEALEEILKEPE